MTKVMQLGDIRDLIKSANLVIIGSQNGHAAWRDRYQDRFQRRIIAYLELDISRDALALDRRSRSYLPSQEISTRPAEQRICDFDDVVIPLTPEEAMFEASR